MLKENKLKVILSSIIILLPCVFGLIVWDKLPNNMVIHWGVDGNADGFGTKAFVVFGIPLIFFAVHFLCLVVTAFDKKQREQSKKALGIIFWIIPFISFFVNSLTYFISFDKKFDIFKLMPILFGIMFILIGNYMPKVKQSRTLGIKITWTLNNEENWNKTHRFAGKIWVITGIVIILTIFLPIKFLISIFLISLFVSMLLPVVYSYTIYRRHKREGISYVNAPKSKGEKIAVRISGVLITIILIFVAVLMFTGDINVVFKSDSFKIEASYISDIEIRYDDIDDVQYRHISDKGVRAYGYSSAKLSMGTFENDEFGRYTLYAYNGLREAVVIKSNDKVLVLTGKDNSATKEIFLKLFEEVN